VAFNVYLDGTDEAVAKDIARDVRESSGGLPALRAIGFRVPERGGVVTVSMNLVDHGVTGLRAAFDAVAERAAAHSLQISDSEIVGLVPSSALSQGDVEYLRLVAFEPEKQILERLLAATEEE
jgi:glutamate formiminotransferase